MSRESWAAAPLPRLARQLMSRNELRRSSDRIEGAVLVMLSAAFLAALVGASFLGAHSYQSQRAAAARVRPAVAVLSQSGPSDWLSGNGQARASWQAPDGHQRSGTLTTVTAPGIWDAAAGTRVRMWVTSSGWPTTPPPSRVVMVFSALITTIWAAGVASIVLIICCWLCRRALDRKRLAAWETDWALTGPRWTSRR